MPRDPSQLTKIQHAQYFATNLVLRGILGSLSCIPYEKRVPFMGMFLSKIAPALGYHRRIRNNLKHTCPNLNEIEVTQICNGVSDNIGRVLAEIYAGTPFWARAKAAQIQGEGFQTFEAAQVSGRPVVLVTGHFGNYEAARSKLIQLGFPLGGLYRRMANPYFNAHYVQALEATGKPLFEQGKRGMIEMVRHLKKGGVIAIVSDLHVYGGKNLDFFGKPAKTSLVPAELALKYNAAFIPVYALREENGLDFKIIFADEIPHSDAITMTQAVTHDLETQVRQHMGQWFWIHKRWKVKIRN